jgi:hypothetical protein
MKPFIPLELPNYYIYNHNYNYHHRHYHDNYPLANILILRFILLKLHWNNGIHYYYITRLY